VNDALPPDLLPDADYGFSFKMRPGEVSEFYGVMPGDAAVLAERQELVRAFPQRHLLEDPAANLALHELLEQMTNAGLVPGMVSGAPLLWLSDHLAPDLLLLLPDAQEVPHLRAAAVCFPSGWAPEEKLGLPLQAIHGVVPALNATLGDRIQGFLQRLKPGSVYRRENWGLAATPELNLHPARAFPSFQAPFDPTQVWFRVERQAFHRLPTSGAVVFGIRLQIVPLAAFRKHYSQHAAGLARGLQTMAPEMASYKGLATIQHALTTWLRAGE